MVDCCICGKPCLHNQELIADNAHNVCNELLVKRRDDGKCVDCGMEKGEAEFQCKSCQRLGSRMRARQAGGYVGP